jgi:hypothetical protein
VQVLQLAFQNDIRDRSIYPTASPVDLSLSWTYIHDKRSCGYCLCPLSTFTRGFREVTAVNAYVNPRFGPFALTGLEFICRAERQTLGFVTYPYIKLSFPLLQAETITSLVFGAEPTDRHFAITFITNLRRSVTFGSPSAASLYSAANVAGIALGKCSPDNHLSFFGVFRSPKRPPVTPVGKEARVHRQYWVRKVYHDPWPEMALCSAAPVTGISHIRVYHDGERQSITGLLLYYQSHPPSVLGELREFYAEYSPPSVDTIQGFAFSYSRRFDCTRIHHLKLLMGQTSVTFGSPISGQPEQLFTRKAEMFLKWTFSHRIRLIEFSLAG